ncbi:MAG TPA: four helix bundle protein [Candidatus Methylomirabilis sp.]|nr:four helix bundle protein [Candidatus Methylomirabilis sp.]
MFRFERLRVWHKAVELYDTVDDVGRSFSQRAQFVLLDQMRRATLSISSNIAEGSGRETTKESQHFYTIAKGSAFEVVSIATVCHRRGLIPTERYRDIYGSVEDITKMLSGLKRVQHTA